MKKIFLGILLVLGFLSLVPSKSFAQESIDYIKSFNSDITLQQDATIAIKETIDYHFSIERHGIYREIPTNYKVTGAFQRPTILYLDELYYFQDSDPTHKYNVYERSSSNGFVTFKIGDANNTIIGDYTYVISYRLVYAVNYFKDHDELYLNVTGNGWDVPIHSATANISVPGKINNEVCYTGEVGSTNSNCVFTRTSDTNVTVSAESFAQYEGLTVAVSMPLDTIANTTNQQRVQFILSNLGVLLPIPVGILLLFLIKKYNKNKKLTVIPNYDVPKGINPLLAANIYKKYLTNDAVTSQIIQMAIDGYIKIKQVSKKGYELIKTDKGAPAEGVLKILYDGIFKSGIDSINLKDLNKDFYTTIASLKVSVEKELFEQNYFSSNQRKIRIIFFVIGFVGLVLSFMAIGPLSVIAAGAWIFGLIISFGLVIFVGFKIDLRSEKGNTMYYELEGLKMYIDTAEKHRIEFHNDPKKYVNIFEKLLPYAMIFGLEKKWAEEFKDIYTVQPQWYEGNTNLFTTYLLVSSFGHINQQVVMHSTPPRSSSGFTSSHGASGGSGFSGGSSGGGFGGGGGGSW